MGRQEVLQCSDEKCELRAGVNSAHLIVPFRPVKLPVPCSHLSSTAGEGNRWKLKQVEELRIIEVAFYFYRRKHEMVN